MTEELTLAALLLLAVATFSSYVATFVHLSTPAPCQAVKMALEVPGSELVVYGRFHVVKDGGYLYLSCGVKIERWRVLAIERTAGVLTIGTTADGLLYIR
ncbi:MAG: hypothetical protein ACK4SY_00480 [Pyrobaculum sp.]